MILHVDIRLQSIAHNTPPANTQTFPQEKPDLSGPLTVIDFEYGAYTPRGFDFGNHFNEYAGFECDYTR